MAKLKKTYRQNSFIYGQIREEFLDADDLDLRNQSLWKAENVQILATRTLKARPGSFFLSKPGATDDIKEIEPATDQTFGILIYDDSLSIIDSSGSTVWATMDVPWTSRTGIYVEPFREKTIIGSEDFLWVLTFDTSDSSWTFAEFVFDFTTGNQLAQAYWVFPNIKGTTITPSAKTGSISVTCSASVFTSDYVGMRICYGDREILITEYVSPTLVRGTVVSSLPPSFIVGLSSVVDFRAGDQVTGADTNYTGIITSVDASSNNITVVSTYYYSGPANGEKLASPSGSATIYGVTETSPQRSNIWSEPVMSPVRGYPRAAASIGGRLTFVNFPQVPDLVCMSSTRATTDFDVGTGEDDDAICVQAGENSPHFLHIIGARDGIILSDRGCYYIPLHDSTGLLTPTSFDFVLFDNRGANSVKPVPIDDGIVFVEASGQVISAATLSAQSSYVRWSVTPISNYHNEIIDEPVKLCGPSLNAKTPEKYLFAVNADGTMAAMSWYSTFGTDSVGFVPWVTAGSYVSASPCFGGYTALVDRVIDGETIRFLEQFDDDAMLDCATGADGITGNDELYLESDYLDVGDDTLIVVQPSAEHLASATVSIWSENWDAGDFTLEDDGSVPNEPDLTGAVQIGFNFVSTVVPWPRKYLESPRVGLLRARLIKAAASVRNTVSLRFITNSTIRDVGGYDFGDDLSQPPAARDKVWRFNIFGNRDHPEIQFVKARPGPFEIIEIVQEVQG